METTSNQAVVWDDTWTTQILKIYLYSFTALLGKTHPLFHLENSSKKQASKKSLPKPMENPPVDSSPAFWGWDMNDMNLLGKFSNPFFSPKKLPQINPSKRRSSIHPDQQKRQDQGLVALICWYLMVAKVLGGVLVFFFGDGWKEKCWSKESEFPLEEGWSVWDLLLFHLGFCFKVMFFHVATMIHQNQTTIWENMFGTFSQHFEQQIQVFTEP